MKDLFMSVLLAVLLSSTAYAQENSTADSSYEMYPLKYTRDPIKCYTCSTHPQDEHHAACNDVFDKDKNVPMMDCLSGICVKYNQNVEGDIVQINRGCADELESVLIAKDKEDGCALSTGTKEIQVKVCNCVTEGCNGVGETKSASSVVMAAGLLCLLAKLMH